MPSVDLLRVMASHNAGTTTSGNQRGKQRLGKSRACEQFWGHCGRFRVPDLGTRINNHPCPRLLHSCLPRCSCWNCSHAKSRCSAHILNCKLFGWVSVGSSLRLNKSMGAFEDSYWELETKTNKAGERIKNIRQVVNGWWCSRTVYP